MSKVDWGNAPKLAKWYAEDVYGARWFYYEPVWSDAFSKWCITDNWVWVELCTPLRVHHNRSERYIEKRPTEGDPQ